jgi:dienelactone hydrolase
MLPRCATGLLAVVLALGCAGCTSGPSAALRVRLNAGPAAAAFDTPVHITVSGLPQGLVTLRAQARDYQGRLWQSAAVFRVGAPGRLNLATATPVSGSYHAADAAGLLWSLHPAFTTNPATQFYMGAAGFTVRLQVLAGGQVQATATLVRSWSVSPTVQTTARDGFASTLFTPGRARPGAPAVVVIGGSEGGEDTLTAGALAMAGYPALALAYFQEPGLPQCLCAIPLEYFARAVRWLRAQPAAKGRPVVLLGGSRGAEGALLIASYEPGLFEAVIASSPSYLINGAYGGSGPAWTFDGKPLPTGTNIPVGRIRVPVLLGDGGQDAIWDSAGSVTAIEFELQDAGDPAPHINLYFPQAGHAFLGTPPYFPYSLYGAHGSRGGTEQANALAEEQSWARMISFLNDPWETLAVRDPAGAAGLRRAAGRRPGPRTAAA